MTTFHFSSLTKQISHSLIAFVLLTMSSTNLANELETLTMADGTDVDIRLFSSEGDTLLLGFACDAGAGIHEEETAASLSEDGVEVWMPDMLSSYMLPKIKSSVKQIPTEDVVHLIETAIKRTGKKIYLIASGPDTNLLLRGIREWESRHPGDPGLAGAILMFPRLNKTAPEPGQKPLYTDAVGTTKLPLLLLEGERTPNRWGIKTLAAALHQGGSPVFTKLIPDVRGYFFKRDNANEPEETVTQQLPGLIKASLFYLKRASQ
ncbi:MAG: hypothetical protein V3W04_01865 [Gammaproteobacteria bacterium]